MNNNNDLFAYQLERRRLTKAIDLALLENEKSLEEIQRGLDKIGEKVDQLRQLAQSKLDEYPLL